MRTLVFCVGILGLLVIACASDPANDLDSTRWRLVDSDELITDGRGSVPEESRIYPVNSNLPEYRLSGVSPFRREW